MCFQTVQAFLENVRLRQAMRLGEEQKAAPGALGPQRAKADIMALSRIFETVLRSELRRQFLGMIE